MDEGTRERDKKRRGCRQWAWARERGGAARADPEGATGERDQSLETVASWEPSEECSKEEGVFRCVRKVRGVENGDPAHAIKVLEGLTAELC